MNHFYKSVFFFLWLLSTNMTMLFAFFVDNNRWSTQSPVLSNFLLCLLVVYSLPEKSTKSIFSFLWSFVSVSLYISVSCIVNLCTVLYFNVFRLIEITASACHRSMRFEEKRHRYLPVLYNFLCKRFFREWLSRVCLCMKNICVVYDSFYSKWQFSGYL